MPQGYDSLRSDGEQAHADELADLPEVPEMYYEHSLDLLLAGGDVAGIEVAQFQMGEQLLARRAVVPIRARQHGRDVERGQRPLRLVAGVIRCIVEHEDGG